MYLLIIYLTKNASRSMRIKNNYKIDTSIDFILLYNILINILSIMINIIML